MTTDFKGSEFVGVERENGFGVTFEYTGEKYIANYTFKPYQQGPPTIAHGGAIASLIDESMTSAVFQSDNGPAFTVSLNISYHAPIFIGTPVKISATIKSVERRKIFLHTQIHTEDGTLTAEADGLFIKMASK